MGIRPDGGGRRPEELTHWPFRVVKNGVEKRIDKTDKETGTVTTEWKWFCSRLEIIAETRSVNGEDWGRLLCVTDRDGRAKEWAMPMQMMAGDGTGYRERLLHGIRGSVHDDRVPVRRTRVDARESTPHIVCGQVDQLSVQLELQPRPPLYLR